VLVVPLHKDVIETKDGGKYKVVEYTNYKEGGPAVYARSSSKELILVYFFDIQSINGTKVEFQRGSRVFHALGKINRKQQLPQPDDKIVILTNGISEDDDENGKETAKVDSLKLKSKALGINKGLFVKDEDGNTYRLKQILDIEPSLGTGAFNRDEFLSYYKDYTGV
jgi:hypothetical protein